MPGHRLPIPSVEELVKLAPEYESIAALARGIGIKPTTLTNRLNQDGDSEQVKAALKERAKPEPQAPEPGNEVSEVEVLRHRVAELESVERKDRRNKVYDERITAAVEDAIATREPRYSPAPIPKAKHSATQHEFFLNWSDLHAGEVVSLEETGGINSYDWDTMLKRQERLREGIFSYQDNRPYPVQTLRVGALGDMLSGSIHDELVATNEIPMAEATVQLAQDGAEWLESLTERFPRIHFSGVVGNHPRAHKKPWAKQGFDNADWSVYRIMEAILAKNKWITFDIPKANQHRIIVAEKWPLLLWHGDGVRSSMPGVPWGGVVRRVTALKAQYASAGKPVRFFNCGHFHSANAVEGGEIVLNGSVKGVDEYSIKAFGGGRPPQQVLQTFHPKHGLTDVSILDLA
jgi:hypothetical protein